MNTTGKVTKKQMEAQREAARVRKAKSREAIKGQGGKVRMRIRIGQHDVDALRAYADRLGVTVSDVVTFMVNHEVMDGQLVLPNEAGCLWESTPGELDLFVTPETQRHLTAHAPRLTPGELLEVLVGRSLCPTWDADDAVLVGNLLGDPVKMMHHQMAYWRRGDRRWQQAIALGMDRGDVWADRMDAHERAHKAARAEWVWKAGQRGTEHAIRVLDATTARQTSNVVYLSWARQTPAADIVDAAFANAA